MSTRLRYDFRMRRWMPVLLMVLAMAAGTAAHAQINGIRASVTSLGGSPVFPPGPRASVTSLGPLGFTPNFGSPNCCFSFKHHHRDGFFKDGSGRFGFGVLPLYSMPYFYGYGDIVDPVDDSMEPVYGAAANPSAPGRASTAAQQQSDDRLSRLEQQIDDLEQSSQTSPNKTEPEPQASLPDQPDTVLVFRDGHSITVKNYAIVGDMLYDFSEGSRHRIALADLDLHATEQQNDAHGLDFRLPTRPLGN